MSHIIIATMIIVLTTGAQALFVDSLPTLAEWALMAYLIPYLWPSLRHLKPQIDFILYRGTTLASELNSHRLSAMDLVNVFAFV